MRAPYSCPGRSIRADLGERGTAQPTRSAGTPCSATGRMNRRIASVPTDVLQDAEVAGHGPPCCIASTTATPVGTPFQTTRPAFATSDGQQRAGRLAVGVAGVVGDDRRGQLALQRVGERRVLGRVGAHDHRRRAEVLLAVVPGEVLRGDLHREREPARGSVSCLRPVGEPRRRRRPRRSARAPAPVRGGHARRSASGSGRCRRSRTPVRSPSASPSAVSGTNTTPGFVHSCPPEPVTAPASVCAHFSRPASSAIAPGQHEHRVHAPHLRVHRDRLRPRGRGVHQRPAAAEATR